MRTFAQKQSFPQKAQPIALVRRRGQTPAKQHEANNRANATSEVMPRHDFSGIPAYAGMPMPLRPKLKTSTPGDRYEQEADRIAQRVLLEPRDDCAQGLEPHPWHGNDSGQRVIPPIVHEVLHSFGQSLDSATRGFMETRFGRDMSHVRVHTGERAAESARALNALAYTVGGDVVFGAGQFSPHTSDGRKLLAHELTHVFQDRRSTIQRQTPVSQPAQEPQSRGGESLFPRLWDWGLGSVANETTKTFSAWASEKQEGSKLDVKLGPGKWGRDNPAKGPNGEKLSDIDFVFPSPTTPINGQTKGSFKIGSNDATISPDPKNKDNSKIDDFNSYSPEIPAK